MNIVNIKFEVHYHDVSHTHGTKERREEFYKRMRGGGLYASAGLGGVEVQADARYRIYVDSDLLAERIWYWGNEHYIEESLFVELDKNVEHTIKLEPLFCEDFLKYPIAINLKNVKIPNLQIINQSKNNLTFKLT